MSFYDIDRNNVESVYLLHHTLETVTVLPEKRASAADLIVNVKRAIRAFNRLAEYTVRYAACGGAETSSELALCGGAKE